MHTKAHAMLADLPPYYEQDGTTAGLLNAIGTELGVLQTAIGVVEAGRFPQTADDTYDLLSLWEVAVGIDANPSALSLTQRRNRVLARTQAWTGTYGFDWATSVSAAIGTTSWTYAEHYPSPFTITLTVPFAIGSDAFNAVEALVRPFTPAHMEIEVDSDEHFIVDVSLVDEDVL